MGLHASRCHAFSLRFTLMHALFNAVQLLEEASQCGVLTASVVDTHSDLGLITYPIYANGAHPAFVHFLLDWIVKVANMPPPSAAIDISK